jgi:hypothetical protein
MKKRLIMLAAVGGAGVLAATTRKRRSRRDAERAFRPADVGFMYAMHAAMRCDLERLGEVSKRLPGPDRATDELAEGWALLRSQLEFHHEAPCVPCADLRRRVEYPGACEPGHVFAEERQAATSHVCTFDSRTMSLETSFRTSGSTVGDQ